MVIYFEFETAAPTNNCFNPQQQQKIFVMSYVLIVAFHPHLSLKKKKSYWYSLEKLTMIDYLTNHQMSFIEFSLLSS